MPPIKVSARVEILEPRDQSVVPSDDFIYLRASASMGSKDLKERIRWRSNVDGFLGQGAEVLVRLTPGEHTLRARVRRRKGKGRGKGQGEGQDENTVQGEDSVQGGDKVQVEHKVSRSSGESKDDSEDSATDEVTVNAVPFHYSGGDT